MDIARILIVEDNAIAAADISESLKEAGYNITGIVSEAKEAMANIDSYQPDIIIMDIELEGEVDGIELAAKVHKNYNIPIIYLTELKDQRTVDKAENIHHTYYLTKPFNKAVLVSHIKLALEKQKTSPKIEGLLINEGGNANRKLKVLFDDIIYLKASGTYCEVWIKDQNSELKKLFPSESMGSFYSKLPKGRFMQVHRSYVVNISHINALENKDVIVAGIEIPIGDSYRKKLKEIF